MYYKRTRKAPLIPCCQNEREAESNGRLEGKIGMLRICLYAAAKARKPALFEKALDGMRELAKKTGLEVFKHFQEFSKIDIEILMEMMESSKV